MRASVASASRFDDGPVPRTQPGPAFSRPGSHGRDALTSSLVSQPGREEFALRIWLSARYTAAMRANTADMALTAVPRQAGFAGSGNAQSRNIEGQW